MNTYFTLFAPFEETSPRKSFLFRVGRIQQHLLLLNTRGRYSWWLVRRRVRLRVVHDIGHRVDVGRPLKSQKTDQHWARNLPRENSAARKKSIILPYKEYLLVILPNISTHCRYHIWFDIMYVSMSFQGLLILDSKRHVGFEKHLRIGRKLLVRDNIFIENLFHFLNKESQFSERGINFYFWTYLLIFIDGSFEDNISAVWNFNLQVVELQTGPI